MSAAFTVYRNNKNNYPYSLCVISYENDVVKALRSKNIILESIVTADDEAIFYSIFDYEQKDSNYDLCILYSENYSSHVITMLSELKLIIEIPIIVISAVYDEAYAVNILRLGADDYIVNNVGRRDLNVRIEIIIKNKKSSRIINDNDINTKKQNSEFDDNILIFNNFYKYFTPNEIKVLNKLVENVGEIVYRQDLSIYTRGYYHKQPDRSVDNLISRIRKKLRLIGISDYQIKSSSSLGYVLVGDGSRFFNELSKNIELYEKSINTKL